MRDFGYTRARRVEDAFAADGREVVPIAGGTELLNWFRLGLSEPKEVIDIGRLKALDGIARDGDQLVIGALATLNAVGEHEAVRSFAPALAQACLAAASAQIRNRATLGGNVLQKTRCAYFRAEAPLPWGCNKRAPGSGCAARHGLNERHALFGWTDDCVAVQPSDPVVALVALDAEIELQGPQGQRWLPVADLHLTPQDTASEIAAGRIKADPQEAARIETRLRPGEIIVRYRIPIQAGQRSSYVKVRERASYEYALVSAAATLTLQAGRIVRAAVALGSVALKPWRLDEAEAKLIGLPPTRDAVTPVLRESLATARPLEKNGYKVAMALGAATRALIQAGAQA